MELRAAATFVSWYQNLDDEAADLVAAMRRYLLRFALRPAEAAIQLHTPSSKPVAATTCGGSNTSTPTATGTGKSCSPATTSTVRTAPPDRLNAIEAEVDATCDADNIYAGRLADMRRALGCTQTDVAQRMGVSQPAVASIETPTDVRLSTLARYLDAIGGHGELVVEFADHSRMSIGLDQLVPANRR